MDRKNWTLLAISFADGADVSPVQLQKCLFLVGRKHKEEVGEDFYEFSYDYGPFSKAIYQDAEILGSEGLVFIERPFGGFAKYTITAQGAQRARQLSMEGPSPALEYLRKVMRLPIYQL